MTIHKTKEETTHFMTKSAFKGRRPKWAKYAAQITLVLTTVATFIIASDSYISAETAVRIGVYLKSLDLLVYGLSETFGITVNRK